MTPVERSPKQALRRYFKLFVPSMVAYMAFIFLAAYLINRDLFSAPWTYGLAILPGLAALAFLFGWFRFIRETDELARRVQTEASMIGLAVILSLSLGWGIMELFIDELPKLPIFYIFPIYFAAQGLASWRLSKKYGAGFCLP